MIRALVVVALLAVTGCGSAGGEDEIVVGAAASLTGPLTEIGRAYEEAHHSTRVRIEFAGSGHLAARVRQGAPIDVLISADEQIAAALETDGHADAARTVAGNELVVLARRESGVRRARDIATPGTRLAIGVVSVPVGSYARQALRRMGATVEAGALANIRSEELDARGLTAKLDQEVVDAVIAYRTDAAPLRETPRVIPLPVGVAPEVRYVATTTSSSSSGADFVAWLENDHARALFTAAGFGTP